MEKQTKTKQKNKLPQDIINKDRIIHEVHELETYLRSRNLNRMEEELVLKESITLKLVSQIMEFVGEQ